MDKEIQGNIASGQLGRFLTELTLDGCGDNIEEWLDMVEARQMNVRAILQTVTNWREMFTSLRYVEFLNVENNEAYRKRTTALYVLGVIIDLYLPVAT